MRFGVVVARAEIDATSDADAGSYGMIISPGVYVIKFVDGPASHPAYDLVIPGVNIAPTRLLDATLARASSHLVSGRVLDANNNGIPDVAVHLGEVGGDLAHGRVALALGEK